MNLGNPPADLKHQIPTDDLEKGDKKERGLKKSERGGGESCQGIGVVHEHPVSLIGEDIPG
jgi:hypothetical protein